MPALSLAGGAPDMPHSSEHLPRRAEHAPRLSTVERSRGFPLRMRPARSAGRAVAGDHELRQPLSETLDQGAARFSGRPALQPPAIGFPLESREDCPVGAPNEADPEENAASSAWRFLDQFERGRMRFADFGDCGAYRCRQIAAARHRPAPLHLVVACGRRCPDEIGVPIKKRECFPRIGSRRSDGCSSDSARPIGGRRVCGFAENPSAMGPWRTQRRWIVRASSTAHPRRREIVSGKI